MEFVEEKTDVIQYTGNNDFFIKQEPEYDNFPVGRDENVSMSEVCDQNEMDFTEEKPDIVKYVQNNIPVDVKPEITEDISSATIPDFVFVACEDYVALNEANHENPRGNGSEEEKVGKQCPYCRKRFIRLSEHTAVCILKFVYPCKFCTTILLHRSNIKRHVRQRHHSALDGLNIDNIYQEILENRKELNVTTAEEKTELLLKMVNSEQLHMRINSATVDCALSELPGVYTDVAYFKGWIDEHIEH